MTNHHRLDRIAHGHGTDEDILWLMGEIFQGSEHFAVSEGFADKLLPFEVLFRNNYAALEAACEEVEG